jgi:hypothetical protein
MSAYVEDNNFKATQSSRAQVNSGYAQQVSKVLDVA